MLFRSHEEALSHAIKLLQDKGLPKIKPVRLRTTHFGARMYAEFTTNKKSDLVIKDIGTPNSLSADLVSPGFVLTNSYDRSVQLTAQSYIYRLACSNGMVVQEDIFTHRVRHTKGLNLDQFLERFVESFERFDEEIVPQVAALAVQSVNSKELEKELNKIGRASCRERV